MKRLITILVLALSLNFAVFGSSESEMTVNDYFLTIPEDYIKADRRKRAGWIDADDQVNGNLTFTVPFADLPDGSEGDANMYGHVQLFKKTEGGLLVGLAMNLCAEGKCVGQILLLDYKDGKWEDVTSDFAPIIDNDEIGRILKNGPAWGKPVVEGVEIPLAIQFSGWDKTINYIAGCVKDCDGGVVAKMFKWNGSIFAEFEYPESPE